MGLLHKTRLLEQIIGEHISRMRIGFHQRIIGGIAVMAWTQVIVKHTANDFFLAHQSQAITGPVVRLNMRRPDALEIDN